MLTIVALLSLVLASQAAGQPVVQPASGLDGVWEGPRKRVPLGECRSSGPGRTTVTFWTEPDGTVRGRFSRASGPPGAMDLTGGLDGGKVVLQAPRTANCGGASRRYTVTLTGAVDTDGAGKRVLKLTGLDQACAAAMSCGFRDEYALTWMRVAPVPAVR